MLIEVYVTQQLYGLDGFDRLLSTCRYVEELDES